MASIDATLQDSVEFINNLRAEICDSVQRLSRAQLSDDRSPHRLLPGTTITIFDEEQLQPYVYYGKTSSHKDVVLKFTVRLGRLKNEAVFYATSLSEVQGKLMPYCYGLYEGKTQDGMKVSCLVMERFGESMLPHQMEMESVDFKMKVMDSLTMLHEKYKVCHESFGWSNVVFSSDLKEFRFVGFGGGKNNHKCAGLTLVRPLNESGFREVKPGTCKALGNAVRLCGASRRRVHFGIHSLKGDISDEKDCVTLLTQWEILEYGNRYETPIMALVPLLEMAMVARRKGIEYSEMTSDSGHINELQTIIAYYKGETWTRPLDDEIDEGFQPGLDFSLELEDDVDEADSGADSEANSEANSEADSGASSGAGPETDSEAD